MQKKVEEEGRKEDHLYKKYECYCKKNKEAIGEGGEKLKEQMKELEAAIAEHKGESARAAGVVKEAKSARESAKKDLMNAQNTRTTEMKAYTESSSDLKQNIGALDNAVNVLRGNKKEGLMQISKDASLKAIVNIGRGVSNFERDSVKSFLANPLGLYQQGSSGEIIGILSQMLVQFKDNLKSMSDTEQQQKDAFLEIQSAKQEIIAAKSRAIESHQKKSGDEALSAAEKDTELTNMKNSYEDDVAFYNQLVTGCADKEKENQVRVKSRGEEQEALTQTIQMLNNDNSLDVFNAAAGKSFIQTKESAKNLKLNALAKLKKIDSKKHGETIALLSYAVKHSTGKYEVVIDMINKLVVQLQKEKEHDFTSRDQCLSDQAENGKQIQEGEFTLNAEKQQISALEESIDSHARNIDDLIAKMKELDESTAEATEQRKEEHEEYKVVESDTQAAINVLQKARVRMAQFYRPSEQKKATNFLQRVMRLNTQASGDKYEKAPEFAYANTQNSASNGVLGMMDKLNADLKNQEQEATHEEQASQKEYEGLMERSASAKADTNRQLVGEQGQKAEKEATVADTADAKDTTETELMNLEETKLHLQDQCNFILKYFDARQAAFETEIEGLQGAKAALAGAAAEPEALLQIKQAHKVSDDHHGEKIAPFGKVDTAQALQNAAADTQNTLVDAVENAEVSEIKRTVFRALTRLRAATIKEFDTIARLETQAIDAYNDAHHFRGENPIKYLHSAEAPVETDKLTSMH